jgi:hypothetical protein
MSMPCVRRTRGTSIVMSAPRNPRLFISDHRDRRVDSPTVSKVKPAGHPFPDTNV